jgi:carboxymethylenebutenolidase
VSQQTVRIRTDDGECAASLHTPEGDGPWPGVLMYPDAAGLRDTFHWDALADLYSRLPR